MKKIFNFNEFSLNEGKSNNLINKIDYTLLKPESTEKDIIELCRKADILGVKSVCVLPKMVKIATEELSSSDVLVCTVISFPHGNDTTEQKLAETKKAISDGADEIDMVLNYSLFNSKMNFDDIYEELVNDVSKITNECHKHFNKDYERTTLKVIVESGFLTEEETRIATEACLESGADFIKTSTGMVDIGAELNKVKIMKDTIDLSGGLIMKIKASGGLRTLEDLKKFDPYVDRFGVGYAAVDAICGSGYKMESDY